MPSTSATAVVSSIGVATLVVMHPSSVDGTIFPSRVASAMVRGFTGEEAAERAGTTIRPFAVRR
jgi:hypothetical protein